jgi:hypothetical protein
LTPSTSQSQPLGNNKLASNAMTPEYIWDQEFA